MGRTYGSPTMAFPFRRGRVVRRARTRRPESDSRLAHFAILLNELFFYILIGDKR
jgi:hypothetical protein